MTTIRTALHNLGGGKSLAFPKDTVLIEQKIAGTYSFTLPAKGKIEVYAIGAGGGGTGCAHGGMWFYGAGGSGAGFIGEVVLPKGEYVCTVGAGGNSQFNPSSASDAGSTNGKATKIGDLITANGGIRGYGANASIPGIGGTLVLGENLIIKSTTLQTNGRNASGGTPGASVYEDYGRGGQGIYGGSVKGKDGYLKIIYKGN